MASKTSKSIPAWLPAVVLIAIVALLYAQTLAFDFTGYDDDDYVTENPYVQRGLSGEMIAWAFTTGHAANWHPLTWISLAIDWQIAGPKPWMHHATNVLLHALNSALLFILLKRSTGARTPSFVVAALFAIHPLNVESVAWIAERKNVLSTFFGLVCLVAYVGYTRDRKPSQYVASCLALALGLMSKPMLVTWPFVMLLFDYWPLTRIKAPVLPLGPLVKELKPLALEKMPFLLLAIASSTVTFIIQSRGGAVGSVEQIPIAYRFSNALVAYCDYIVMTFWPFGLAALYPLPIAWPALWKVAISGIALLTISVAVVRYGKTSRYLVTGWFFFLGTLVPVIGIVQVGSQAMADRYAYVPLIGLFMIIAWGITEIATRRKIPVKVVATVTTLAIILLAMRSWDQLRYWRNGLALWEHTVAVTENNCIAHNNLGSALVRAKQPDRALMEFNESLRISPNHVGALVNIARLLLDQNRPADAAKLLEKAVSINPSRAAANLNLAVAYFHMHDIPKALQQAKLTQQISPADPKVYNLLGILSDISGQHDDAVNYLQTALRIDPNYANAKTNLDRVLSGKR